MKACEKSWKKKRVVHYDYSLPSLLYEEGWREALEFVKSEIFEHREALDVIEEELEEI